MATKTPKVTAVPDPADAWENGTLGRDPQHVECASAELKQEIDDAVGMQMISIRLQKQLIEGLKLIARVRGIGYQPLIRDALGRFARMEVLLIAKEFEEQEEARQTIEAEMAREKRA